MHSGCRVWHAGAQLEYKRARKEATQAAYNEKVPSGLEALPVVPSLGWAQILVYFMFVEYTGGFEDYKAGTPGDYGWKVLTATDPVERRRKLNAELANGRLAMVAIMAMLFQNGLAGTTGPEMWLPQL